MIHGKTTVYWRQRLKKAIPSQNRLAPSLPPGRSEEPAFSIPPPPQGPPRKSPAKISPQSASRAYFTPRLRTLHQVLRQHHLASITSISYINPSLTITVKMPSTGKAMHITTYSHSMNRTIMPIPAASKSDCVKVISKSDMPKGVEGGAYRKMRNARSEARLVGVRERRAKVKADEAAAAKK